MQALIRTRSSIAARLFQQSCRAHSRVSHFTPSRAYSRTPDQSGSGIEGSTDGLQWFDQDVPTGHLTKISGNPEEEEAEILASKLGDIRSRLKAFESDPRSPEFANAILRYADPADRRELKDILEAQRQDCAELVRDLRVDPNVNRTHSHAIKLFNNALVSAASEPTDEKKRKALWSSYRRLKHDVPTLPDVISKKAWEVLWETQYIQTTDSRERDSHTVALLDDLVSSGRTISTDQSAARLEALMNLERIDQAVDEWTQSYSRQTPAPAHVLERGIQLFAHLKDSERAGTLVREYVSGHPDADLRLAIPLIHSYTNNGQQHVGFALYAALKACLGSDMTMQDYDLCAASFLQNNCKELALAVFRDMMLSGKLDVKPASIDTLVEGTKQARLQHLLGVLALEPVSLDVTRQKTSAELCVLPREWRNKYFYASWMKKLIGLNSLDDATKVVELMQERDITPDPIHMNGLIGAYFRSGNEHLQAKGEELAWAMIERRVVFVEEKKPSQRAKKHANTNGYTSAPPPSSSPLSLRQRLPAATIESFNVLALHYLIKQRWSDIRTLENSLYTAKLRMSTYFMNKLLYTQLYTNAPADAWRDFLHYTGVSITGSNIANPQADMESFDCLWTAGLKHLGYRPNQTSSSSFPRPRTLMHVMVTWHAELTRDPHTTQRQLAAMIDGTTPDIYINIMQSFIVLKDYSGCLVAMHILARLTNTYPDNTAARVLVDGIANLAETHVPTIRGRTGRRQMVQDKQRAKNVRAVLAALVKRRATIARRERGVELADLRGRERAVENLNLLSELVRVVMVRSVGAEAEGDGGDRVEAVEESIRVAAEEMGVAEIETGDVDSSRVA